MKRSLGCAVVFAVLFCAVSLSRAVTNDLFARGLELSRSGQFPEAAAAFEKSAAGRPAVGTLLNLGLAEWQRGHSGAAILAWEQARWIDPFNLPADTNLNFARQAAQVDGPQLKWFEAISTWLPPNAWVWLAGGLLWLAVGLLVLPGVFRRRIAGWQQWLAAVAFGCFLFSVAANFGVVSRAQIGFVIRKNAPLQLTPTQHGEIIATLASGESARRLKVRGNYVLIRTAGASGWIDQADFRTVCPP